MYILELAKLGLILIVEGIYISGKLKPSLEQVTLLGKKMNSIDKLGNFYYLNINFFYFMYIKSRLRFLEVFVITNEKNKLDLKDKWLH